MSIYLITVFVWLYINLYSPTSGSKSKNNNTKHKFSRSKMLTRVDIIMTYIIQHIGIYVYFM